MNEAAVVFVLDIHGGLEGIVSIVLSHELLGTNGSRGFGRGFFLLFVVVEMRGKRIVVIRALTVVVVVVVVVAAESRASSRGGGKRSVDLECGAGIQSRRNFA